MKRRYLKREIEREILSIEKKSRRSIKNLLEKKRAKNSTYLIKIKRLRERKREKDRELKRDILIWKKEKNPFYLKRKLWEIEKEKARNRTSKREMERKRYIQLGKGEWGRSVLFEKKNLRDRGREIKERASNSTYRGKQKTCLVKIF